MSRTVEEYLALDYRVELRRNPDGSYFAEHPDLPGCMTEADTPNDAVVSLVDAARDWIQDRLDRSLPIPVPIPEEAYSGKFVIRLPSSLHAQLARRAAREGTSLNQLVMSLLSAALGRDTLTDPIKDSIEDLRREVNAWLRTGQGRVSRVTEWPSPHLFASSLFDEGVVVVSDVKTSNAIPFWMLPEGVQPTLGSATLVDTSLRRLPCNVRIETRSD